MSRTTRILRFLRHWHARIGVLAALFFLLLAITGIALNHTQQLRLAERQVGAVWLMHWYGLRPAIPESGYALGRGYFVSDGARWLLDGKLLPEGTGEVVGAVESGGLHWIATPVALYLYQADGRLLDQLDGAALPLDRLSRIGVAGGMLVIEGVTGAYASADGLEWQPFHGDARWAVPQPLPDTLRSGLQRSFAPHLPLERVLLDLHSGRIFGRYGPLVMDLAALILVSLALSGTWIYLRSIRRRH